MVKQLNQADAWFLEIAFVCDTGMHICLFVCVYPQRLLNTHVKFNHLTS